MTQCEKLYFYRKNVFKKWSKVEGLNAGKVSNNKKKFGVHSMHIALVLKSSHPISDESSEAATDYNYV